MPPDPPRCPGCSPDTPQMLSKVRVFLVNGSSPLGLRTEISARYCLETTRTGAPHLFVFMEMLNCVNKNQPHLLWEILPHFLWKESTQFSVDESTPFLLTHFTHYTYFTHFTHFMNQLAATWAHGPRPMGPGPMWLLVGS